MVIIVHEILLDPNLNKKILLILTHTSFTVYIYRALIYHWGCCSVPRPKST